MIKLVFKGFTSALHLYLNFMIDSNPKKPKSTKNIFARAKIMDHEEDRRRSFSENYLFGFESGFLFIGKQ